MDGSLLLPKPVSARASAFFWRGKFIWVYSVEWYIFCDVPNMVPEFRSRFFFGYVLKSSNVFLSRAATREGGC